MSDSHTFLQLFKPFRIVWSYIFRQELLHIRAVNLTGLTCVLAMDISVNEIVLSGNRCTHVKCCFILPES